VSDLSGLQFCGKDFLFVLESRLARKTFVMDFIVVNFIVMELIMLVVMNFIVMFVVMDLVVVEALVVVTIVDMHGVDSGGNYGGVVDVGSNRGHWGSVPGLDGLVDDVLDDWLISDDTGDRLRHLVNDVLVVNLGNDWLDDLLDESLLLNSLDGLSVVDGGESSLLCGLRNYGLNGSEALDTESLFLSQSLLNVLNSVRQDGSLVKVRVLDVADHRLLVNLSDGLLDDLGNQSLLFSVCVLLSMNVSKDSLLLDGVNHGGLSNWHDWNDDLVDDLDLLGVGLLAAAVLSWRLLASVVMGSAVAHVVK